MEGAALLPVVAVAVAILHFRPDSKLASPAALPRACTAQLES